MENTLTDSKPSLSPETDPFVFHWILFSLIAGACLIISGSFVVYLINQNHALMIQRTQQTQQLEQVQQAQAIMRSMLQDVANFSGVYPESRAILTKHGFNVIIQPPPTPVQSPPPIPAPTPPK